MEKVSIVFSSLVLLFSLSLAYYGIAMCGESWLAQTIWFIISGFMILTLASEVIIHKRDCQTRVAAIHQKALVVGSCFLMLLGIALTFYSYRLGDTMGVRSGIGSIIVIGGLLAGNLRRTPEK